MKNFLSRFGRSQTPAGEPAAAPAGMGDSRFFSTQFMDNPDEELQSVSWAQRAQQVQATPAAQQDGTRRFAELWGVDQYVAALSEDELAHMARYLQFVQVPPDQEVIGQDEQGDYMLIVLDGTVAVDRVQPWGGRARLAEARAGDMLGEMSLLDAGTRFSACTTLTPCLLAVLDAQALDRMITQDPRLGLALLASLSRRLSLRLRQVSARLSALLSRA